MLLFKRRVYLAGAIEIGLLVGRHQLIDLLIKLPVIALVLFMVPYGQKLRGEQSVGISIGR